MKGTITTTLPIVLLIIITVGCSQSTKAPTPPSADAARALLQHLNTLERSFGLAVIGATPATTGGSPLSVAGTEGKLGRVNRQLEFLKKGQPMAEDLTEAKTKLQQFVRSSNSDDWQAAWRHLDKIRSGLTEYTSSEVWTSLVPSQQSRSVTSALQALGTAMDQLQVR